MDQSLLSILAVAALALGALALVVSVVAALVLRRMRRAYVAVVDARRGEDLFQALARQLQEVQQLREDVTTVHHNTERLRELLRATVSRVGVVRYDAFDDMGGALSFSAALLDEDGNGVVLSAINGRTEARTYAKDVVGRTSSYNLSPEEQAAIDQAMSARRGSAPRRRGRAAS